MSQQTFLYRTERIGLRPLSSEELSGPYPDWFLDEQVHRYNSHFRKPSSIDEVRKFVASLVGDSSRLVLAIYSLLPQQHIGNISLQQIDHFNHCAELAFLLGDRSWWNQGIAQEAAELLIRHGRDYLALRRFSLGCLADNKGMNRLAEKLGFAQEGVLQKALWHCGEFRDVNLYGYVVES
ncbi:MAG: GNAT family N-acetyltransferase [Reinekea sp.]